MYLSHNPSSTVPMALVMALATLAVGCQSTSSWLGSSAPNCHSSGGLDSLEGCRIVEGDLMIDDRSDLTALSQMQRLDGSLWLRSNLQLHDLSPLSGLSYIGGDLHLVTLPELTSIEALDDLVYVEGDVQIVDVAITYCDAESLIHRVARPGRDHVIAELLEPDAPCDDEETASPPEQPHGDASSDSEPTDSGLALKDAPIDELPPLDDIHQGHLLEEVHPEVVDRIRLLIAVLRLDDIDMQVISGYRPFEWFDYDNRLASWHNVGMAVDLLPARYRSMEEANRAHRRGEDAELWDRVRKVSAGLGIIWGEWFNDIFHFEWHPGYHARIRQHEFDRFTDLAGDDLDDHSQVWQLFEPDALEPNPYCAGGCPEVPDDGLRHLLEHLRDSPR